MHGSCTCTDTAALATSGMHGLTKCTTSNNIHVHVHIHVINESWGKFPQNMLVCFQGCVWHISVVSESTLGWIPTSFVSTAAGCTLTLKFSFSHCINSCKVEGKWKCWHKSIYYGKCMFFSSSPRSGRVHVQPGIVQLLFALVKLFHVLLWNEKSHDSTYNQEFSCIVIV